MQIRDYRPGDADTAALLYYETVRFTGRRDYTKAQVEAWAPTIPDGDLWHRRMSARHCLIADESTYVLGFVELERDGHLDMIYVAKGFTGKGIGSALYERIEGQAKELGVKRLFVEASKTARPLFERKGFAFIAEQGVMRNGIALTNYRMEKRL